ncbi:MAG: hypothetical protein P8K68_04810 [Algibacter sp.]|uniref:hypothetical protein n=1 Tax=Algibacter sp. TaxID=1872428 RepID=UPI0026359662|nr:hypothetical protein [Algibacter sp.]MDG2178096.1 hypothetical protein [Algibacter sp.]
MHSLVILFLITVSSLSAQTIIDYNLKKGFVANGYDVVAYFNNEAIAGDKKFSTSFDGTKFKFSSEENLKT